MQSFRVKFKTAWQGKKDKESEKESFKPDQIADVDMDTFRALVFQHSIAEAVPVDEIIAAVKDEKKPATGQRASRKKAKTEPDKDKMQRAATTK